jgi:mannosylglycoprotein endo-beta-mannosidase
MSFMKMPVLVRKKVVRIQRDFLWGGVNGNKKLSWVKWEVVCRAKNKGGLGVRNLEVVNISLLMKWRWRLLNNDDPALWKDVLVAKYGNQILNNVNMSNEVSPYYTSNWWKDVSNLEGVGGSPNWLEEVIGWRLGNGMAIRFWRDVWLGDSPLCHKFPRLFSLSVQKEVCVGDLLKVEGERRRWDFCWRRNFFQWEEGLLNQLVESLENISLSHDIDRWVWKLNPEEGFSVKSAYDSLMDGGDNSNLSDFELSIFSTIWESPAPSKVVAFSWKLLHDRIPTKDNLSSRGLLHHSQDGGNCVWCDHVSETANHLFLFCNMSHAVWYEIFKWLGVVVVMPPNVMTFFAYFTSLAKNIKTRKGLGLVWHTALWVIWCARNKRIFKGEVRNATDIVEEIKVLSWKWSVDRLKVAPCLFYEWCWDPGYCFSR